ncbi:ThiF family adenylyltransferase [uncultured Brevundimonas sp.]|uniref:ThiF family adenylyltransferase n=1 Tax=uncultured Brevundimonas sp. TaxID=213418 RepID=UPI002600E8AB|nr:ThiF family adenylyltransferase [uncultured Brevundimonas sp.]
MKDADKPDYLVALELARIKASAGVVAESVSLSADEMGQILDFDLRTEAMAEAPKADIHDVEPIRFVYTAARPFGEGAPRNILCGRADFPRDIGHLCSGPPGCPAAPCLSLGGSQPLYERGGIEAVLERLRSFMRDAKTGSLMADGWEAVPFGIDQKYMQGQVTPDFFQDLADANSTRNSALGVAVVTGDGNRQNAAIINHEVDCEGFLAAAGPYNHLHPNSALPWIFVWPDKNVVRGNPVFEDWPTAGELRRGLQSLGLEQVYNAALGGLLNSGVDFKFKQEPLGGKGHVLILGVWRPSPMLPHYFGYSDDDAARRLELRAYFVSTPITQEALSDEATVEAIVAEHPATPELLRWVSGIETNQPVSLFGMGALGSAIFNNLIRAGQDDIEVSDLDRLAPHNLARHEARWQDVYSKKAEHAPALAKDIFIGNTPLQITPRVENVVDVPTTVLASRVEGRLIVDATADERVRNHLDALRPQTGSEIVRSEIFHEGRLGATFVSLAGGPSPSELLLCMMASAVETPAVADWLADEAARPFGADPFFYGFGCGSQTVHLPNYVVEQHASTVLPFLLGERGESGFAINALDEAYRPTGWRWQSVQPFTELTPATCEDWRIRLAPGVVERLQMLRSEALPAETGGYLYGAWDPKLKTITIVTASALPPNSTATPTTLELGPAGETVEERMLARKTQGRVFLCGTWHSHPNASAKMSGKDYEALRKHHEDDAQRLCPSLLVIIADGDLKAHMML